MDIIKAFSDSYLGLFSRNFRMSKFSSTIDGSSPAINSNSTEINLGKRFEPNLGRSAPYSIKFDNSLLHPIEGYTPILSSEVFGYADSTSMATVKPVVDAYLDDDGYGNLRIYKQVGTTKVYLSRNTGSIDYDTGTVSLRAFKAESLGNGKTDLLITVTPRAKDIFARRNQIIVIDTEVIAVTGVPEKTVIDNNASDSAFNR